MTKRISLSYEETVELYNEYLKNHSLSFLEQSCGISRKILSREFKKYGFKIFANGRIYGANENFFETIDTEEKAYWLGFIAADGNICRRSLRINLNERDKAHLEKFKKAIQADYPIKKIPGSGYGTGTILASLEINSVKIINDLKKFQITENKSNTLKPPNIQEKFYKDWIRGYLDGDGSVSILKNGNFQLSFTGTKEVLDFIQNFLTKQLNRKYCQRYPERDNNNYSINFGGTHSIIKYLNQIYENCSIYLERKYQKVLEIYSRFEEQSSKLSEGELLETPKAKSATT